MMERSKCMNIPKVRFHGFKEKWREESLSKLFVERHEISTITESLPQLSFTISEGVIYPDDRKSNKRDFLIKDILSKKYLITCVGDILYNPANVIYGAIHRNSLCDGVVSPIYKIFKTEQDSNFMECVVRNPSFISQLSMKTEGTVTKLKTLKPESFLEMIVKIAPSIYEQRKIASYFQTLDSLIQTTSKKLASLKQIKAASLQSMFPREGETVPKVRFKGFEERWLLMKINDVCKQSTSRLSENSLGPNAGNYAVYGANGYLQNITTYDYDCPYIGIIKDGSGAGRSRLYPKYSSIIGTMQYIIPKETINIEFLAYLFETINFTKFIIGSSIPHIYYKNYCVFSVSSAADGGGAVVTFGVTCACGLGDIRLAVLSFLAVFFFLAGASCLRTSSVMPQRSSRESCTPAE